MPEYWLVATNLDGFFLGKFLSINQFRLESSIVVTSNQLDPNETFSINSSITDENYMWESVNKDRRCLYTRNSDMGQGYVERWIEDLHGEWNEIEVGDPNLVHDRIPSNIIEGWRRMEKRKGGGQSKGGVYELDPDDRTVKAYKENWSHFGLNSGHHRVSVEELMLAGRKGFVIERPIKHKGRLFVHSSQCDGETFQMGNKIDY